MTRYHVPSATSPGVTYEVTVTDDAGLVCECRGYVRKVAVSYLTGIRHGSHSLCRHANAIADANQLPPRQPLLMWSSLADGDTFPITSRPRGPAEHMMAYWYQGALEPLEAAVDEIYFPVQAAMPDRNRNGRIIDLLTMPTHELVIATTGTCPPEIGSIYTIKKSIAESGAAYRKGGVTAATNLLAVGNNPSQSRMDRAWELHIPTVDFPGLMAILSGRRHRVTDHAGQPLSPKPETPDLTAVAQRYAALMRDLNGGPTNPVKTSAEIHMLENALHEAATRTNRLTSVLRAANDDGCNRLAEKALNEVGAMLQDMAAQTQWTGPGVR